MLLFALPSVVFLCPCGGLSFITGAAAAGNNPPVAEAGLGVMAYVGDKVILNGESSSDIDGQTITYTWTQLSGSPVALVDPNTAKPSFVVDAPGTLRFQLVVNDGALVSAPDTVAIVVPDRELLPLGDDGGCATAPGPAWAWLAGAVCLVLRRRT